MSRVQNADWKLQGGECSWDDLVIESECSLEGAQWISESHGCLHLGEWWMLCWTESNVECSAMLNTVQCWTECNVEHRVQRSVQQIRRMFAPQWVALMACCDPQFVRQAHCQCLNSQSIDCTSTSTSTSTNTSTSTLSMSQSAPPWLPGHHPHDSRF